jgi:hypothetical protein
MQLVQEEGMTRALYAKRKTAFILSVLEKAGLDAQALEEIRKANV